MRRRPSNHKEVWGFNFSDILPLLSECSRSRYPYNWIGRQLHDAGKLTSFFLENHYFRNQEHNSKQFTVSSAIRWIITRSKPEYFASSSERIGKTYSINPSDISYDLPIHSNVSRFPQIDYLENPGRVIRQLYLAAIKEKRVNIPINSKRIRRKYRSKIRMPTMKRLKELLQQLREDPNINHKIFGYSHNIYLDDDSNISQIGRAHF